MAFKIGDSIKINDGVLDPDTGADMSGWQGRVIELGHPFLVFAWDSISLQIMGQELVDDFEIKGLNWERMVLSPEDISHADERDTPNDVKRIIAKFRKSYIYYKLENEEKIIEILKGINPRSTMKIEQRWFDYLNQELRFPIKVEVSGGGLEGPFSIGKKITVLELDEVDNHNGIMVKVESKADGVAYVPLCNLKVLNQRPKNYKNIYNYADWFINARID